MCQSLFPVKKEDVFACSAIADKLKTGQTIEPQSYKEASVYFSDIVGFTSLCSMSSPMQVIDFLNDLWTIFDDTIEKYNVYKVHRFVYREHYRYEQLYISIYLHNVRWRQ